MVFWIVAGDIYSKFISSLSYSPSLNSSYYYSLTWLSPSSSSFSSELLDSTLSLLVSYPCYNLWLKWFTSFKCRKRASPAEPNFICMSVSLPFTYIDTYRFAINPKGSIHHNRIFVLTILSEDFSTLSLPNLTWNGELFSVPSGCLTTTMSMLPLNVA